MEPLPDSHGAGAEPASPDLIEPPKGERRQISSYAAEQLAEPEGLSMGI
jgi:hypothetical protein